MQHLAIECTGDVQKWEEFNKSGTVCVQKCVEVEEDRQLMSLALKMSS